MLLVAIEQAGSEISWRERTVQELSKLLEADGHVLQPSISLRVYKEVDHLAGKSGVTMQILPPRYFVRVLGQAG